jgi:hypothetical protein
MSRRDRLRACRDCGAPIRFVSLPTGAIPVDPHPHPGGNVAAMATGSGRLYGHVISKDRPRLDVETTWMPHAASCPQRAEIRAKKPAPPPTLFDEETTP